MSIAKRTGIISIVLCFSSVIAVSGMAQSADEGTGYNGEMKSGLHLSAESSSGSLLSEAARTGASVVISGHGTRGAPKDSRKKTHTVEEGDTLWDICTEYFGDAYVWPRIWSYNTRITNPHWIYPGDVIWLVPPSATPLGPSANAPMGGQMGPHSRNDAILQRNRGYVDEKILERSGTVRGAHREVMLLSQYDEAYVEFESNREIQVGDEFAAFEVLREVDPVDDSGTEMGKLVEILGTVRVIHFDRDEGIARVVVDESIKPITRGTMVGPIHRRFDLIPSTPNQQEMKAHVVAHLEPGILFATHHIVFVDKGKEEGVREGNRFFAITKRDFYKESINEKDDHEGYPFEVIAEMRVLETRPHTSTCIVTAATRAMEDGQELEMVKGY